MCTVDVMLSFSFFEYHEGIFKRSVVQFSHYPDAILYAINVILLNMKKNQLVTYTIVK